MNKQYLEQINKELTEYTNNYNYNKIPLNYELWHRKYSKSFYFIFNGLIFEFLESENKELTREDITEIKALLTDYLTGNEGLLYYANTLQLLLNRQGFNLYRIKIGKGLEITLFFTERDKYKENKKDYWTKIKNVNFSDEQKRLLYDYIENKEITKRRIIYF